MMKMIVLMIGLLVVLQVHHVLSQDYTTYDCIDRDYKSRCLVGPGLGFVSGATGTRTATGKKCTFSYASMVGDLTGKYMTRHSESCSFPPDQLWMLKDRNNSEFYNQFITNNVQCVAEGAPPCANDVTSCEWEPCAINQCVDLPFCDQNELRVLGQPPVRIVPEQEANESQDPDRVFVSTARELVWALRQTYIQIIEIMESVTLSREDFDSLPAIVTRSVTVKAYSADVQVSIAVDVDSVIDTRPRTAVVLVGDGGVLEFEGLCTRGSLLYLWSSLGSPRNLNTLPTGYLRDIAVMPGGEVRFVNSVIQSTDTLDAATTTFPGSLLRVYTEVIRQASTHRSAKDVFSTKLGPDAFQYHDQDSSYVKDLTVPVIFGGVHHFVDTLITRSRNSTCKGEWTSSPLSSRVQTPPPGPESEESSAGSRRPTLNDLEMAILFVLIFFIWLIAAAIVVYMRGNSKTTKEDSDLQVSSPIRGVSISDWVDADQSILLYALSKYIASVGDSITISEAFEEVAKQSMTLCLRRSKEAYTLKVCTAAIAQHELYSRAMQEQRPHPSHCMSTSITSASMFVESLREMQGNVTRAGTHAAAVGILGSVAESLASRTVSGSDMMSMLSFERSDRDVVVTIADSAESQQTGEIIEGVVDNESDEPPDVEAPLASSASEPDPAAATLDVSASAAVTWRMLEAGDVVSSSNHSYLVQRMVGRGSTSLCFVAEDTDSLVQVALKVPIQTTAKMRKTLIEEANCMTRLKHPYIVQMVESFTFQGRYIIVLELCQMQELQLMVNISRMGLGGVSGGGSLHASFLGKVVLQLCLAVKHVHEQSIVHRDIKLSNIYLDNMMNVKLGDFGASKFLEGVTHSFAGTPLNMAPEVLLRRPYNLSSDIWSLGMVLYELCTLQTLFDVNNVESLITAQRGTHQHLMAALGENHSLELSDFVSKLLNTDPEKRPTASELLDHPYLVRQLQIAYKEAESDMQAVLPRVLRKSLDGVNEQKMGDAAY